MYKFTFLILLVLVCSLTIYFYFFEIDINWELFIYWLEKIDNINKNQFLSFMFFFTNLYLISVVFLLPFCGVLSILGGTLFGWTSFWLSMFSSLVGAFLVYHFLYLMVFRKLRLNQDTRIKKFTNFFNKSQLLWLVFLRLLPIIPFSIVSAFSAQIIRDYKTFLLGTIIGSAPGLIAHTLIGIQIKNIIISDYDRIVSFNALVPVTFICLLSLIALYFNKRWAKDK